MLLVPEPHLEQLEVKVFRKRETETSAKCPQWLNSTCLRAHIGPPGKKHRHWRGVWELSGCQLKGHSEWRGYLLVPGLELNENITMMKGY